MIFFTIVVHSLCSPSCLCNLFSSSHCGWFSDEITHMALVGLCRGVRLGVRPTDMSYSPLSHLTLFFKLTNTFSAYCFKEPMMQRKNESIITPLTFKRLYFRMLNKIWGWRTENLLFLLKETYALNLFGMKLKDRKGSKAKTLISSGRAKKTSSLIPCLLWTWEKGSQGEKDLTINVYADKYTDAALSPYPPVPCALHNKNSRMISILL